MTHRNEPASFHFYHLYLVTVPRNSFLERARKIIRKVHSISALKAFEIGLGEEKGCTLFENWVTVCSMGYVERGGKENFFKAINTQNTCYEQFTASCMRASKFPGSYLTSLRACPLQREDDSSRWLIKADTYLEERLLLLLKWGTKCFSCRAQGHR